MVTSWLYLVLAVVALVIELWAFVDSAARPATDYQRADKRTKGFWLALTAIAAVVGVMSLMSTFRTGSMSMMFLNMVGVVVAGVYLADVRPPLQEFGRYRRNGGRESGSIGPW